LHNTPSCKYDWCQKRKEKHYCKIEQANLAFIPSLGKLHRWASKDIPSFIVVIRVFCSTKPTPLILAYETSHMVTSFIFLHSNFALWTLSYVCFRSPTCKFIIHLVFALLASMPWLRANKAKLMSALTSNKRLLLRPFDKMSTVWLWAPFCVRVYIDPYIEHESFILRI